MQTPHKKSFAAEQQARQKKKSPTTIALIVLAVVIAISAVGFALYMRFGTKEAPTETVAPVTEEKPSIAVLPFTDMSPEKDQEYFCDGIAETIINNLSKIRDLRVIARTSAFSFKGKDIDIRVIGDSLDVKSILEGSVQKEGNSIRVTAQLINVIDGSHIWSNRYDREIESIFAIQDDISQAIVEALKGTLLEEEKAAIEKRYTENTEAYDLYLLGRHFHDMVTEEGLEKATGYYGQALQLDPNYALVIAGLGDIYITHSYFGNVLPPHEAYSKARAYANKALEIDDTLAEAHELLGKVSTFYDWNWKEAERELQQALKLNPNSAEIHRSYSYFLTVTGRHDESIGEAKRARELDPLSSIINADLGQALSMAGRLDEAIEELQKTIAMDPESFYAHFMLGWTYSSKSMLDEAITVLEKAVDLSDGTSLAVSYLAETYYRSGKKTEAKKLYDSLVERSKHEYIPPTCFFLYHFFIGDLDQAFDWLEKAYDTRDNLLCWQMLDESIKTLPFYSDFRSDPRYRELLKKVGLK